MPSTVPVGDALLTMQNVASLSVCAMNLSWGKALNGTDTLNISGTGSFDLNSLAVFT